MPLYSKDMGGSYIQSDYSTLTDSKVSLWFALIISVILHVFLFLMSCYFDKVPDTTRLESREFHIVIQPKNESTSTPIMESNASKVIIAKSNSSVARKNHNNFDAPAHAITRKRLTAPSPVNRNAPKECTDIPARVSILDSAKDIIAAEATTNNFSISAENSNLSEEHGGNIFSPAPTPKSEDCSH